MAGVKRLPDQLEMLDRSRLLDTMKAIPSERDRALAAFVYLTGARISEVLGTFKKIKKKKYRIRALKKRDIEVRQDDDLILVNNVPCLKRSNIVPRRIIPIVLSQEYDFLCLFWPHYAKLEPDERLFDISRITAWKVLNRYLGIFPHFLIHQRCTHLVTNKQFSDTHLKQFRGWSSTAMAGRYTHLNFEDVANKMR